MSSRPTKRIRLTTIPTSTPADEDTQRITKPLLSNSTHEDHGDNNTEIIKFRDETTIPYIPTGYKRPMGREHETRQRQNHQNSGIYKIPPELKIEIMLWLEVDDIFRLRQVSRVFLDLSSREKFAEHRESFETKKPPEPRGSIVRQTIPPRFSPPMKFRITEGERLKLKDLRQGEKDLRRRERLCQPCRENDGLPGPESDYRRQIPRLEDRRDDNLLTSQLSELASQIRQYLNPFCSACFRTHPYEKFSSDQLAKSGTRFCADWERKLSLCSHHKVSWVRLWSHYKAHALRPLGRREVRLVMRKRAFQCSDCIAEVGKYGMAPTITFWPNLSPTTSTWNFKGATENLDWIELTWRLVVCVLDSGQVVTKDLLRQGLERLQKDHGDFCCSHMMFTDESFMSPFSWDRCACFRESATEDSDQCYLHYGQGIEAGTREGCCACYAKTHPQTVGRLMADRTPGAAPLHTICCEKCTFRYKWGLNGCRVVLEGFKFLRPNGTRKRLSKDWIQSTDPRTCRFDDKKKHFTWCSDTSCPNSKCRTNS